MNACELLSRDEIQAVQGEAPKQAKSSSHTNGGVVVRQCFFETPTFNKSVTLLVSSPSTAKGERPRDLWRKRFQNEDATRDPSNRRDGDKSGGGKEEEKRPPQRIDGLGDQAYWVPNGASLYVLKGNSYLRISVGGDRDESARISRCRTLARHALRHLAQFD